MIIFFFGKAWHVIFYRNRITAKQSRDRKVAYIRQLELNYQQATSRIAQLESELFAARVGDLFQEKFANNSVQMFDE